MRKGWSGKEWFKVGKKSQILVDTISGSSPLALDIQQLDKYCIGLLVKIGFWGAGW